MTLPIRHGEGRLIVKSDIVDSIDQFVCLRYEENVNGSFDRIAALDKQKRECFWHYASSGSIYTLFATSGLG